MERERERRRKIVREKTHYCEGGNSLTVCKKEKEGGAEKERERGISKLQLLFIYIL